MRILYVEDNEVNQALVARVTRIQSHELVFCSEGEQALELLTEDSTINLILMDIELAGLMTGLEVVHTMRARNDKRPVVAVTAYAMMGDREKMLDAGCDQYLPKPLQISDLLTLFNHYAEIFDVSEPAKAAADTAAAAPAPAAATPAPVEAAAAPLKAETPANGTTPASASGTTEAAPASAAPAEGPASVDATASPETAGSTVSAGATSVDKTASTEAAASTTATSIGSTASTDASPSVETTSIDATATTGAAASANVAASPSHSTED